MRIRVGHSPDPDDAFMVWALAAGKVASPDLTFELVPKDIQTLNERALGKDPLEATALSLAAYARVTSRYLLLPHGASFGEGYGPVLVAAEPMTAKQLASATIAIPGELTTAFMALRMALPGFDYDALPFDAIAAAVKAGEYDAGLLIHEGQLTFAREGLHEVLNLGKWWADETGGLPLPLGVNAVREDLGPVAARLNRILKAAIEEGLKHRAEALAYARAYARGLPLPDVDRFVEMYVNGLTLDMGERGRAAVAEFLRRAQAVGLVRPGVEARFAPDG